MDKDVLDEMVEAALHNLLMPDDATDAWQRMIISRALCAALLAAEARGFKLVGRNATDAMKVEWVRKFDNGFGPQRMWEIMHDAAPGIGEMGDE